MKVLSFTTLWPNPMQPFHGLFNRERIRTLADCCEVQVVAPIAWMASVKMLGQLYYKNNTVIPTHERLGKLEIWHPRYGVIPKVFKFSDGYLLYVSLRKFVRTVRRDFPFDLIDAYYAYPDGFAAGCLAESLGVPYTISVLGSDITLFSQERLRGALIRRTLARATRVFCVSESLKAELLSLGIPAAKIDVIENGVDCQKFAPFPQAEARRRLNLPQESRFLLSIGHLRELKGFHLLVDVVHRLHQERKSETTPVKLLLVGGDYPWDPTYKERLMRQIADAGLLDDVILAGARPPEELHLWYSAADLFCLASSREGCPNVILESLACGTPVVATPVGDIPRLVPDRRLGVLVERQAEAFYEAITQALQQTWDRTHLVQYAQGFSWEKTSQRICRIFETILTTP